MKHLLYISAIIFIIGSVSCKKDKKEEGMVLSGTIIDDCSGKPLANFQLHLNVDYTCVKIGKPCNDAYYFSTDANGSFTVDIVKKGFAAELRAHNGTSILKGIPLGTSGKELHLGSFIARPTTSFVYRIKVNNPYNVGDTLVTDLKGLGPNGRYKFAAPLSDTSFTINNYSILTSPEYSTINLMPIEIGFGVFKDDINYTVNWYNKYTRNTFNIPICQQITGKEVVLEIN